MEIIEITQKAIKASEGHIITNGKSFGDVIVLGSTDSADNWYEITDEEYNKIEAEQTEDVLVEE